MRWKRPSRSADRTAARLGTFRDQGALMSSAAILTSIFAALMVGAVSPGPSFVVVSRIAISRSRLDGLAAAFGMGVGGVIFGILALAGLTALLTQFEWLYLVL